MITRIHKDNIHLFEEIYQKRTSQPLSINSIEDDHLYLYVIHDEAVYGWISIVKIPKIGYVDSIYYLDELYIAPENRHKGYAKQLLDHMHQTFKDKPQRLYVELSNNDAIALYEKEHFKKQNQCYYMTK
ncbi:hypothetical protein BK011_02305 [Tenericutes bacterium MZ-XQ]|nr:hypothetical protein BK011_02305 [Tenericutes bacterium MZ-XQ]